MNGDQPAAAFAYRPQLDGLRAVAVIAVVFFHLDRLPGGYLGVDLFFVLSGFLITSLLLTEGSKGEGTVNVGAFFKRRIKRLLPASLALVAVAAIATHFFGSPTLQRTVRGDGIATLAYVANWHQVSGGSDYWAHFAERSPLIHTWSLAIEEQFYLVWPLIMWVVHKLARSPRRATIAIASVGASISFVEAMIVGSSTGTTSTGIFSTGVSRAYFGTDTRIGAILIGALAAALLSNPDGTTTRTILKLPKRAIDATAAICAIGLGSAWWAMDGSSRNVWHGGLAMCGVLAAVLIALISTRHDAAINRVLTQRPLVLIGLISYGVYLWHWPIIVFVTNFRTGLHGWVLDGVRIAASIAAAAISYCLVEKPVRSGHIDRQLKFVAPMSIAMCAALLIGATSSSPPTATRATLKSSDIPPPGTPPQRILVLGDSVGFDFVFAIDPYKSQLGLDIHAMADPDCAPAYFTNIVKYPDDKVVSIPSNCAKQHAFLKDELRRFKPDIVLFLYGGPGTQRRQLNGTWQHACDREYDNLWSRELGTMLDETAAAGAHGVTVRAAFARGDRIPEGTDQRVTCQNAATASAMATSNAANGPALPPARELDLAGWVCPRGDCRIYASDGSPLRYDGIHFGPSSQADAALWIVREARRLTGGWPR